MSLHFIITTIAYSLNERMARRCEYLREEVCVLREMLSAATGKRGASP